MKNNYMICMMAILSLYNIGINAVESQSDDGKNNIVKKTEDFLEDKSDADIIAIERVVYWVKRRRIYDALRSKNPEDWSIIESLNCEKNSALSLYDNDKIDRKINLIKDLMVIKYYFDPIPESNEGEELHQLQEQIQNNEYDRNKPELISEIPLDREQFIEEYFLLFKSYRAGKSTAMDLLNAINKFFHARE